MPEREPWGPALVVGSERTAIAVFREDSRGDLVDIDFYCTFTCEDKHADDTAGALWWPTYSFAEDYETCCSECGTLIHRPYGLVPDEDASSAEE